MYYETTASVQTSGYRTAEWRQRQSFSNMTCCPEAVHNVSCHPEGDCLWGVEEAPLHIA